MPINNLIDQLKRDEGESLKVYRDTKGILTVGVGHNVEAHHENLSENDIVTQQQVDNWLENDVETDCKFLSAYIPWTDKLDPVRRAVFQNMTFNMGVIKLLGFHHMLGFAQTGHFALSKQEMLNSEWATEVGDRAKRLAIQLESGIWQ